MPTEAPIRSGRIGLVAGGGCLPIEIAARLEEAGQPPFVVSVTGEAAPDAGFGRFDNAALSVEEVGRLVPLLKRNGVERVVLAGTIERRPHWRKVRITWSSIALVARAARILASGDDGVLRAIVRAIEADGIRVVGAHEIVPGLLAQEGPIGLLAPDRAAHRDMDAAAVAARAIGALDIGQAAVAIGGRAIALEGIEGTDGLLERVAGLRAHGRLAGAMGGVLVKCAKPGQELRTDLPAVGPNTVTLALAAGLAGIAVEAGRSLLLDRQATIAGADAAGLFLFGLQPTVRDHG